MSQKVYPFRGQFFHSLPQRTALTYFISPFFITHLNVSESATIQSHGNAKRTSATSKPYYRALNDGLANTKKLLKQEWKQRLFMIKSMTNQVVCTLVHHKGNSWEIQVKCINKKKESVRKEPHDDLSTVIRLQSQSCELIRTIFITCKSYQFFLATMSNYNMLNCFVAAVTVFYQLIQLSIFVTVGSLTLVITIKGWWILMIIQNSWVQPWSIFKGIHQSFVSFC